MAPSHIVGGGHQRIDIVHHRRIPNELLDGLRAARRVEDRAVGRDQWLRAVAASGQLMLAAVDAGWRAVELADALGMERPTIAVRIRRAREVHGDHPAGITVPSPEVPDHDRPLEERQWLRAREVRAMTGISPEGLDQWRHEGLLPATRMDPGSQAWYSAVDIRRIASAPRRGKTGVDRAALRALISGEPASEAHPHSDVSEGRENI